MTCAVGKFPCSRDYNNIVHNEILRRSTSDDDFAEMPAAFHIPQGLGRFLEGESFVNHRPQPIAFYGLVHFFKHLARTNENSLHTNRLHQDTSWVELAGGRQDTDTPHVPCDAH